MITHYNKTINNYRTANASKTMRPIAIAYNVPTSTHLLFHGLLLNIVVIIVVLLLNGMS